ncbi:MAG: ead/Ea22-like family protein [Bacteroidales bacterium]|nr:ead/Ea22-like family protein [Candidatus Latescibacterota bacterium]
MNDKELRKLAEAATEGPWTAHDGGLTKRKIYNPITKKNEPLKCRCAQVRCEDTTIAVAIGASDETYTLGEGVTDDQRCVNAAYIAAANPKAIIERLNRLDSQQAKIDRLMLEHCPDEMTDRQLREWAESQVQTDENY